ncbi:F-box/LRR-repeat protein [Trifolium repens]|nr:F-box/LRR-repeat protein [Trifolium repens]
MELKRRKRNSHTQMTTTDLLLPDDCWESVFKFLNQADDGNDMKSLSLVSKQFLSITNRLRFSLNICDPTLPFLCGLFKRFTNLTSLSLTHFHGDLNQLLCQIARFPLNITSLNLSNKFNISTIPFNGLLTFSKKITTLTSLTYFNIYSMDYTDFVFIADCFPLLEEIDLSSPYNSYQISGVEEPPSLKLLKLRKVRLECQRYINDQFLFHLFKNCKNLEEAILLYCYGITDAGIASALAQSSTLRSVSLYKKPFNDITSHFINITSHFIDSLVSLKGLTCLDLHRSIISDDLLYSIARAGLPLTKLVLLNCDNYSYAGIICLLRKCRQSLQHLNLQHVDFLNDQHVVEFSLLLGNLVFINLSGCNMLTEATLFALVRNCASLSEIKMKRNSRMSVENSDSLMDFGVYPQLKSLCFTDNLWLNDETIIKFASIFPNLQVLDLSYCNYISDESVCQVLRCCKIRYLNLTFCKRVDLHGLNFEVFKLEVLILSFTEADDETLNVISRNCRGLLQLKLECCHYVTEKGVNQVIEKCTQMRKINLAHCGKLHNNIVDSMLYSRPSIRKIKAPKGYDFSYRKKKHFLHQGCILK